MYNIIQTASNCPTLCVQQFYDFRCGDFLEIQFIITRFIFLRAAFGYRFLFGAIIIAWWENFIQFNLS